MRPFVEGERVHRRVGRSCGNLIELGDGHAGEGLLRIEFGERSIDDERLVGGELALLGIVVEHGVNHIALRIDSSEVAIDGGHPEGDGAHELVGGDDILSCLVPSFLVAFTHSSAVLEL